MKIWGLSRSTVWPSGTHCATCCINVGRGMVVWFLTRNSILYCNYLSPSEKNYRRKWPDYLEFTISMVLKKILESMPTKCLYFWKVGDTSSWDWNQSMRISGENFISGIRTRCMTMGNWAHWPCSRNACGFNGFYIFNYQFNGINWRFTRYKNNLCRASRLRKKTWRWSKFIPQGVFVWQFAIFQIREGDWKKKRRTLTKPLSRMRSRTRYGRYFISNLGF